MREVLVSLALLIRTNVQDRPCLAAVYGDCGLRMGTFSLAFRTTILAFVERARSLRMNLPGRTLRNPHRIVPFLHQRLNPQLNQRLNLCLVTGWIYAQRFVPD